MMSARAFPDRLLLAPNDDQATCVRWPFITQDIFRFYTRKGEIYTVPAGFATDFASIPWFIHWKLSPHGRGYIRAAVVHDWMYRTQKVTRKQADDYFSEGMAECDTPRWQDAVIYWSVRLFGEKAWEENKQWLMN